MTALSDAKEAWAKLEAEQRTRALRAIPPRPAYGYSGALTGQPTSRHIPGRRGHSEPELSEIKEAL